MLRFFAQYLAIYNNVNWPKSTLNVSKKVQILTNKPSKSFRLFVQFYQSGKISPNLVTLVDGDGDVDHARADDDFKSNFIKERRKMLLTENGTETILLY